MLIEGHTQCYDGRFEPEVNVLSALLVGFVADASQLQQGNQCSNGDKDGVEHNPSRPLLYLTCHVIDTEGDGKQYDGVTHYLHVRPSFYSPTYAGTDPSILS